MQIYSPYSSSLVQNKTLPSHNGSVMMKSIILKTNLYVIKDTYIPEIDSYI